MVRRPIWDVRVLGLALQYHELITAVWRQVVDEQVVVEEDVASAEEVAGGSV